jgi:hypothetical protein
LPARRVARLIQAEHLAQLGVVPVEHRHAIFQLVQVVPDAGDLLVLGLELRGLPGQFVLL